MAISPHTAIAHMVTRPFSNVSGFASSHILRTSVNNRDKETVSFEKPHEGTPPLFERQYEDTISKVRYFFRLFDIGGSAQLLTGSNNQAHGVGGQAETVSNEFIELSSKLKVRVAESLVHAEYALQSGDLDTSSYYLNEATSRVGDAMLLYAHERFPTTIYDENLENLLARFADEKVDEYRREVNSKRTGRPKSPAVRERQLEIISLLDECEERDGKLPTIEKFTSDYYRAFNLSEGHFKGLVIKARDERKTRDNRSKK